MFLLQQFLWIAFSHMIFSIPILRNLCSQTQSSHMWLIFCQNYFYPMNLVSRRQKCIVCDVPRSLFKLFMLTFVLMWHCYAIKLHQNHIHFYLPHTKFPFLLTGDPDVFWTSTDIPVTENAEYPFWDTVQCFHAEIALVFLDLLL